MVAALVCDYCIYANGLLLIRNVIFCVYHVNQIHICICLYIYIYMCVCDYGHVCDMVICRVCCV